MYIELILKTKTKTHSRERHSCTHRNTHTLPPRLQTRHCPFSPISYPHHLPCNQLISSAHASMHRLNCLLSQLSFSLSLSLSLSLSPECVLLFPLTPSVCGRVPALSLQDDRSAACAMDSTTIQPP